MAAGLEVQRLGVALVARQEIETELPEKPVAKDSKRQAAKFATLDEMAALADAYRQQGLLIS